MKKFITRTLSAMLAAIMLTAMLPTNAFAVKVHVDEDGNASIVEETPVDPMVIKNYNGYRTPYATGPDRPLNNGGTAGFVYYITNNLRQYMPHVTDAQLSAVTPFRYPNDARVNAKGWIDIADAADLHAYFDRFPELRKQLPEHRYLPVTSQTASEIYTVHKLAGEVNDVYLGLVDTHDMDDEQLAALRAGGFLDFVGVYDGYTINPTLSFSRWLSDSMRNDTTVRNIRIGAPEYLGENVFRNSAVETIVFSDYWLSDHVKDADGRVTNASVNGLIFGKEAIIIEANSFADCANLKSVIVPCEPARLYIANGVFANCPNLTVYAPAGGTLESYCKANGIKFSPIANGYIEPRLETPLYVIGGYFKENGWYKTTAIPVDSFSNAVAMLYYSTIRLSDWRNSPLLQLADKDINRYRSEAVRANDIMGVDTTHFELTPDFEYTNPSAEKTENTEPASGQAQLPAMPDNAWYKSAVTWAYENNLVSASLSARFVPNNACSRADVVDMLYSQAGRPDASGLDNPFTDVSGGAWYTDAVKWAAANNIVNGIGDGKFAPESTLTRAQIVQILYNQNGRPDASKLDNPFTDVGGNAWYTNAVKWAAANSVVNGVGGGRFAPEDSLTYAQIAQILYNMK